MDASKKQREPVAFKSLAELKRFIRPGVEFKTVSHANHADMVGLTRVVTTVQTVGFYSKIKDQPEHPFSTCNHGKGFYTDFGKAGNYMGSLFDGIGGFPLAAIRSGITPVWASEIEVFPIEVTKLRFPDMLHVGDITKLNGAELPPVDIICGGSPCQDLSVAGARAGLAGARSGLFMEQMRIVREMRLAEKARGRESVNIRPRWMCWENVPGAFSSGTPKYEDFRIVLEEIVRICFPNELIPSPYPYAWPDAGELTAGGAFSLAWRCLDAQFWGVAQRRKRIFLLADFAGPLAPQLLFDVFDETENRGKEVT